MPWRYQPVWIVDKIGDTESVALGLCEVHFDNAGNLKSWTEEPFMTPIGEDIAGLSATLAHMLGDLYKWKPVAHADLKVGMTFERLIPQAEAEALANFIDATAHNFKAAASSR